MIYFFTIPYEVNETLLLAKEEEKLVSNLMEMTWNEFNNNKDTFSIPIILSYIRTLLNLTERFYVRQFDTQKNYVINFQVIFSNY